MGHQRGLWGSGGGGIGCEVRGSRGIVGGVLRERLRLFGQAWDRHRLRWGLDLADGRPAGEADGRVVFIGSAAAQTNLCGRGLFFVTPSSCHCSFPTQCETTASARVERYSPFMVSYAASGHALTAHNSPAGTVLCVSTPFRRHAPARYAQSDIGWKPKYLATASSSVVFSKVKSPVAARVMGGFGITASIIPAPSRTNGSGPGTLMRFLLQRLHQHIEDLGIGEILWAADLDGAAIIGLWLIRHLHDAGGHIVNPDRLKLASCRCRPLAR